MNLHNQFPMAFYLMHLCPVNLPLHFLLPISYCHHQSLATSSTVESSEASSKKVINCRSKVCTLCNIISVDSGTQRQLVDEIKALPQGKWEKLIAVFETPVTVSAENAIALKANFIIPWKKLKAMNEKVYHYTGNSLGLRITSYISMH